MPSDFSKVGKFYTTITQNTFLLSHQYYVTIDMVDNTQTPPSKVTESLTSFYTDGVTVPGRTLNPIDLYYQGIQFGIPGITRFTNTLNLTVKCDEAMTVYDRIYAWVQRFTEQSISDSNIGSVEFIGKKIPQQSVVKIYLLKSDLSPMKTYILEGAFPISIGDITMSQEGGAIATFPLGIRFQYWYCSFNKYQETPTDILKGK